MVSSLCTMGSLPIGIEDAEQLGSVTDQIHSTPRALPVQVLLLEGAQLIDAPESIPKLGTAEPAQPLPSLRRNCKV